MHYWSLKAGSWRPVRYSKPLCSYVCSRFSLFYPVSSPLSLMFSLLRIRGISKIWVKLQLTEAQPEGKLCMFLGGGQSQSWSSDIFFCTIFLCSICCNMKPYMLSIANRGKSQVRSTSLPLSHIFRKKQAESESQQRACWLRSRYAPKSPQQADAGSLAAEV